jgi:pyruvate/2-oxoglutarate dehydrogenase complex dihydrolipoamide dehydrogenase (E3) component
VAAKVDENRRPIAGTEITFDCDTILLSVGLIPENELSKKAGVAIDRRTNGPVVFENMGTSIPGMFACGNVVHVHDLVDFVTAESQRAGAAAASYVQNLNGDESQVLKLANGDGVTYTVPQRIRIEHVGKAADVFFRVNRVLKYSIIKVNSGQTPIARFKREHLAPGEMEHIMLPRKLLDSAVDAELTISVEEVVQ